MTASSPWCVLARRSTPSEPKWGKKGLFVMLMLEEALARVRTTLNVETLQLTISTDNQQLLVADLNDEGARGRVEEILLATGAGVPQRADAGAVAATGISWTSPTT